MDIMHQLVEYQIDTYTNNLINKEPVSRFAVFPYRKEIRKRLENYPDALDQLEMLIESVKNTI
jgi:hypothetical protein